MHSRIAACLLLLALSVDAAAADIYGQINSLRAGAGECAVAANLQPLRAQAALERVARDLAHGATLERSLHEVGYSAAHSSAISIRGDGADNGAAGMLSGRSYCRQLQNAAMSEVGVYQDARQVWIVMAAPMAAARQAAASRRPSDDAPAQAAEQGAGQGPGQRILALINQARATSRQCGGKAFAAARALRWNDALAEASWQHADDMARNNYFSHDGRDGSVPSQRVERAGYRWRTMGENIAAGQRTAEEAVAGWIASPGHCANLMNPGFTEMGAAVAVNAGSKLVVYWAQEFGAPR
jgi:uncharacterized protein YkwD